jgi:hypothetical protein
MRRTNNQNKEDLPMVVSEGYRAFLVEVKLNLILNLHLDYYHPLGPSIQHEWLTEISHFLAFSRSLVKHLVGFHQ